MTVAKILERFPLISIEFICIFAPISEVPFKTLINVPPRIEKYLRVINVPPSYQSRIKQRYGGSFFPEYNLRNIGIRHARGTYIFCGSSDVLMPPSFFQGAERHLFSPLSCMRSNREYIESYEIGQTLESFDRKQYASFHWLDTETGFEKYQYSLLVDACGDFQGAHRSMWESVQGYIESREIFHVDSALAGDMTTFMVPILFKFFPGEKHIIHVKISIFTPHLTIFGLYNRDFMWRHFPTSIIYQMRRN
jgi:hypothetical protein